MADVHKVSYTNKEQDLKKRVEEEDSIARFYKRLARDYYSGKLVYKEKK